MLCYHVRQKIAGKEHILTGTEITSPTVTNTPAGRLKSTCTGAQLVINLKTLIGRLHFFSKGAQAFMKKF